VYAYRKTPGSLVLHRLLVGASGRMDVDHIDGNGLNNRRSNLRIVTRAQNIQNSRLSQANTSGVKGASRFLSAGKWQAKIRKDGKQYHLGLFNCRTAAAVAYAKASRELHGEFGRTA
jgi:hypothetical protein